MAASLSLYALGDKSLWLDEAISVAFALGEPEGWWVDHNMSLYYALLALVVRLFGTSEAALRGLSAACFVLSVPVLFQLARELFGARVARTAGLLFATHAYLLQFAQEARGYMLAVLLTLISAWALTRLVERPSWRLVLVHALSTGLAFYAHLFALWPALGHALAVVTPLITQPRLRKHLIISYGSIALLGTPLALSALSAGASQVGWLYPVTLGRLWSAWVLWSGRSEHAAIAYLLCWLGLLAHDLHARVTRRTMSFAHTFVLAWLLLPVLATYVIALLAAPVAHPKYLLVIVAPLVLGASVAIAALPSRVLRMMAVGALLLASAHRDYVWHTRFQKEPWREVTRELAARMRVQDGLVLRVLAPEPVHYYAGRLGLTGHLPIPLVPAQPWGLPVSTKPALDVAARARITGAGRVWLLSNRPHRLREDVLRTWVASDRTCTWTKSYVPYDEDDELFSSALGRSIKLELFERR